MSDKRKAILLRISPEVWEALNRWAKDELRSVTAQIEYVLREAIRRRAKGRGPLTEPERLEAFWQVLPWFHKVTTELRAAGLTAWAQRLEGAAAFAGSVGETATNLRATLEEMMRTVPEMPEETAIVARGLLRWLNEGLAPVARAESAPAETPSDEALGPQPNGADRESGKAEGEKP